MAWYKGIQEKCQEYDKYVTANEGYVQGDNWANTIKHTIKDEWAILKHDNYTSEMILESELSSDWFPEIEI